jgi:hypothetical protein
MFRFFFVLKCDGTQMKERQAASVGRDLVESRVAGSSATRDLLRALQSLLSGCPTMHTAVVGKDGRLRNDQGLDDASHSPRSSANLAISMTSENACESETEDLAARPTASKRRECVWVNHWKPELGACNSEDSDRQEFLKRTTIIFHQLEVLM